MNNKANKGNLKELVKSSPIILKLIYGIISIITIAIIVIFASKIPTANDKEMALFLFIPISVMIIGYTLGIIIFINFIYTTMKRIIKIIKNEPRWLISFFSIAVIILGCVYFFKTNKNVYKIITNRNNLGVVKYEKNSFYFMHNKKIYYFIENGMPSHLNLYKMNINGTENKLVKKSEKLNYPEFYFLYNDEAYFYSDSIEYNKINLNTGKIKRLNIDPNEHGDMIKVSFNDGYIILKTNSSITKYDLKKDGIILTKTLPEDSNELLYQIDSNHMNIYYVKSDNSQLSELWINDTKTAVIEGKVINILKVSGNIYIYTKYKTYILEPNTNKIVGDFDLDSSNFIKIDNLNINSNYFYYKNSIYIFNAKTNQYDILLKNIDKKPQNLYEINNSVIFTNNVDNSQGKKGNIIIYNKAKKKAMRYNNVRKITLENKKIYIMQEKNKKIDIIDINL